MDQEKVERVLVENALFRYGLAALLLVGVYYTLKDILEGVTTLDEISISCGE